MNQPAYQQALRWKQDKVEELADPPAQISLITDITELEGRAACTETFQQISESHISLHSTLDDLFIRDSSSVHGQKEDINGEYVLVTELRVEDRRDNKSLFEVA